MWMRVEGRILFVDDSGLPLPYPADLSEDVIESSITGKLLTLQDEEFVVDSQTLKLESIELGNIGKISTYSTNVSKKDVMFVVEFEYGPYQGVSKKPIRQIIHTMKMDLNIRQNFIINYNTEKKYKDIMYIENPSREYLDMALYYHIRVRGIDNISARNYYDAVLITKKYLDTHGYVDANHLELWYELQTDSRFWELKDSERFRVLREIGLIFVDSPNPFYAVEPGLFHVNIGLDFLGQAIRLYSPDANISFTDFSRAVQEKYMSECNTEKYDDCFETIEKYLSTYENVTWRTRNAFLSQYINKLEQITNYGIENNGSDRTEEEFIKRMVGDREYRRYWLDFHCMFERSDHLSDLSRATSYVSNARDRSKRIADLVPSCTCS